MPHSYELLKREIIDEKLCTLCGACEAACPTGALSVTEQGHKQLFDCSTVIDHCDICYSVCPHTGELLEEVYGEYVKAVPQVLEGVGRYRKIVAARSEFADIRDLTKGGGVATTLLVCAIENRLVDTVAASETEEVESVQVPLKWKIPIVPDYLPSMLEVRFHPAAVARAYGYAVYGYEKAKIAFVGIPCHMTALRKLVAWKHRIAENLKLAIGLFCLWTFSTHRVLDGILKELGITREAIERVEVKKDVIFHMREKTLEVPLEKVWARVLEGCKLCADYTASLADISVGWTHPLPRDWSLVIIRSEVGEKLVQMAVEQGFIQVREVEQEVLNELKREALKKIELAEREVKRRLQADEKLHSAFSHMKYALTE